MAKRTGGTRSAGSSTTSATRTTMGGSNSVWGIGTLPGATNEDIRKEIQYLEQGMNEPMIVANPQMRIETAKRIDALKNKLQKKIIKTLPAMPGKYKKATFEVNGQTYSVSNTPTGYGIQQKRNGRFTLVKPDGSYVDFRYGDSYGGYTSQSEAYKELKSWVKDYIK